MPDLTKYVKFTKDSMTAWSRLFQDMKLGSSALDLDWSEDPVIQIRALDVGSPESFSEQKWNPSELRVLQAP